MLIVNSVTVRLFGVAFILVLLSGFAYIGLAYWLPYRLMASSMFRPIAEVAQNHAAMVSLTLLGFALFAMLRNLYRYAQWASGKTPACPRCGTMMEVRSGRYGLFWGCLRYPNCRGTEEY